MSHASIQDQETKLVLHCDKSAGSLRTNKLNSESVQTEAAAPGKRPSVLMFNITEENVSHVLAGETRARQPSVFGVLSGLSSQRPSVFSRFSDISFSNLSYTWNYRRIFLAVLLLFTLFLLYILAVILMFNPHSEPDLPVDNLFSPIVL